MKKLYYGPIVLGLAALALGTQVSNATTVLANDGAEQQVQTGDQELAKVKSTYIDKLNEIKATVAPAVIKGNIGGATAGISQLPGQITYAIPAINRAGSLESLDDYIKGFEKSFLAPNTINTIKVTIDGKDYEIKNVPMTAGQTTEKIKLPVEAGLPDNYFMNLVSGADGQTTAVVLMQGPIVKNKFGIVKDNGIAKAPVTVDNLTITSEKLTVLPTEPTKPDTETKPGKDTTKPATKPNHSKDNHKPAKDDSETKPEVKPADDKTIVSHKMIFATSTTDNVSLYKEDGTKNKERALGKNSLWVADKMMTLNGVKYVRVATNEWAKLTDGLEIERVDSTVTTKGQTGLFTADGNALKSRALAANSSWRTDRTATINGQKMYRVATNEWMSANDIK